MQQKDGFIILAGNEKKLDIVIQAVITRINGAKKGVPRKQEQLL